MFIQLSSTIDESRLEEMSRNTKIEEYLKPDGTAFIEVYSLMEASSMCKKFIERFNLGNSNWRGGLVVDENFNFIARVSFNGKVWNDTDENWRISKEITI